MMKKITEGELRAILWNYNAVWNNEPPEPLYGVIVYSSDNWDEPYTEEERSYRVSSRNNAFEQGKISNSIFGNCLDGKDLGVRLDQYDWAVDYCYMEEGDADA